MASLESLGADRGLAAVLMFQAATYSMDVYSAVNSSPWTAETVTGGDPEKEASLKRYCTHAVLQTALFSGAAAWLAGPGLWPYPLIGASLETAYMTWLYWNAVRLGRASKQAPFGVGA